MFFVFTHYFSYLGCDIREQEDLCGKKRNWTGSKRAELLLKEKKNTGAKKEELIKQQQWDSTKQQRDKHQNPTSFTNNHILLVTGV